MATKSSWVDVKPTGPRQPIPMTVGATAQGARFDENGEPITHG